MRSLRDPLEKSQGREELPGIQGELRRGQEQRGSKWVAGSPGMGSSRTGAKTHFRIKNEPEVHRGIWPVT